MATALKLTPEATEVEETSSSQEILEMKKMLKETVSLLHEDYRQLTTEVQRLLYEKMELMKELATTKDKISSQVSMLKLLEEKEHQLKKVQETLDAFQEKTSHIGEVEAAHAQLKSECELLTSNKHHLTLEISRSLAAREEIQLSLDRMEKSLKAYEQELALKKEELSVLEKRQTESRLRLENYRHEEFDLLQTIKRFQGMMATLSTEVARLEGEREYAMKQQEDMTAFLKEKKAFFEREFELLKVNHQMSCEQLTLDFALKKNQWEKEFKEFSAQKESELESFLAQLNLEDQDEIKKKQKILVKEISAIFESTMAAEKFTTHQDKLDFVQKEVAEMMESHFGHLSRWKHWTR